MANIQSIRAISLATTLLLSLLLWGCRSASKDFQGYVEGDYIYVAAPLPGTLMKRSVDRGALVKAEQELFQLERELELAAQRESQERYAQAAARLENLKKGKRPTEIAALEARIAETKAKVEMAKLELDRLRKLTNSNAASQRDLDQARTNYDGSTATLQGLNADLKTAGLGAREDEILAAAAELKSLEQQQAQANWRVDQKIQRAVVDALVSDTFYEEGGTTASWRGS